MGWSAESKLIVVVHVDSALGNSFCGSELPKPLMWFAIGIPVVQFVDEEDVVPLCSARCSLVVVEQRKNRHVMSGIRKKVMGNGEVGQTKKGGVCCL